MEILHIAGSPRGDRSASRDVAEHFIDRASATTPNTTCDTLNVWTTALPEFDGPALAAKYAGLRGDPLSIEQERAWTDIKALAARFRSAELILFSVPMWNFGIPYRVKQLIDAVSQKDLLFAFDGEGLKGLLNKSRVVVVAARGAPLGGDYPAAEFDHQVAYLRTWSRMVGINQFDAICIEGTLFGPEADAAARADARAAAERLAAAI